MGYLKDRQMVMRYRGEESSKMALPGGGPQEGLLGALLFIVLVNDCGLSSVSINNPQPDNKPKKQILATHHLKYVDDLSLLETINLRKQLVVNE